MGRDAQGDLERQLKIVVADARGRLDAGGFEDGDMAEAEILWLESMLNGPSPLPGTSAESRARLESAWERARVVRRNAVRTRRASLLTRRAAMRSRRDVVSS